MMDVKEAIAEVEWHAGFCGLHDLAEATRIVTGELERLTALCEEYRGERDAARAELSTTNKLIADQDELRERYYRHGLKEHPDKAVRDAELRAETAESALTRARAEGMEESAVKVDELKATLEDLALQSRHAVADNAYQRAAYEAELTAASIRAAKGGQ